MQASKGADTSSSLPRRKDKVQSVERALILLEALADSPESASALKLAARTGLNRTVVYRLLRTMAEFGLLEEKRGAYQIGPRAVQLGYTYLDRLDVRRAALGYAVDLCFRFVRERPWVVSLAIPVGDEVILVDRIWGPNTPLDTILEVGTRLRFDGSALGRAMLATWESGDAESLLGRERFEAVKPILARIRAHDGIAISFNEVRPGLFAIASPILGPSGQGVASLCISGPVGSAEKVDEDCEIALYVKRATQSVAEDLKARGAG